MGRVVKAQSDPASIRRHRWDEAYRLWTKYNPDAVIGKGLALFMDRPKPNKLAAYALATALVGVCGVALASHVGLVGAHGAAMKATGIASVVLTNPFFGDLHDQLPKTMAVLGFAAPASLFSVNSRELWRVRKLPEAADKVISWLWRVAYNTFAGISRFFSAMKKLKPVKRIRGLIVRLRTRRRPASPAA